MIRSSFDFLIVAPESRRIIYGGASGRSDDWELLSYGFDNGKEVYCMIDETGSRILLMVPQTIESLCGLDIWVPVRKGS